jgi:tetratricopeptide (TPR) repeat protein
MVSDKMLGILLFFCLFSVPLLHVHAQTNAAPGQIRPALQILDSTKEQDGLVGSVRRVKTEYARITINEGHPKEGPRQLLEVTTYGVKGNRVENVSYPITDSTVGREEYKYDDHGNIIEKVLRDDGGAVLSREAYDYVFDDVGNWTKMVTSVVVIENGELKREPTEVTYRTLTYYAGASIPRAARGTEVAAVRTRAESNSTRSEKPVETALNPSATADPPKVEETQPSRSNLDGALVEKKVEAASGHASGSMSQSNADTSTAPIMTPVAEIGTRARNQPAEKPRQAKQESTETPNPLAAGAERGLTKSAKKAKTEVSTSALEARAEPPKDIGNQVQATPDSIAVNNNPSTRTAESTNAIKTSSSPVNAAPTENAESANAESAAALTKALEFYRRGRERFDAGDVSSAITAYLESIRLEPNSAEIHLNLGHAYLTSKKDKDAAKAFREAVRLNPELAEAFYGLGFVSFRLTRYKDAMDAFKKATVLAPDMAKAHYGLALSYQELGKLDLLIQEQRLLQRLDPKLANKLVQAFSDVDFSCRGGASRYCN